MKARIMNQLQTIEEENNVKILYAVQAGSRAWGFSSPESDLDIRFIYHHPLDWYLSLEDRRDVIEKQAGPHLELSGWDLKKALNLFRKSNPSLLEWLHTEEKLIADEGFYGRVLPMQEDVFSPQACFHHYLSMSKVNYRKWKEHDVHLSKLTLHLLRGILSCLWIKQHETFPPVEFDELAGSTVEEKRVSAEISDALQRKRQGVKEIHADSRTLISFIDEQMDRLSEGRPSFTKERRLEKESLNEIFRDLVKREWNK